MEFVVRIAAGRIGKMPFQAADRAEACRQVAQHLGLSEARCGVAEMQMFRLGTLAERLCEAGDVDGEFLRSRNDGVKLGEVMGRTPAVLEKKTRWNHDEGPEPGTMGGFLDGDDDKIEELFAA